MNKIILNQSPDLLVFIGPIIKDGIRNNINEAQKLALLKWTFELILVKKIPFLVVGDEEILDTVN